LCDGAKNCPFPSGSGPHLIWYVISWAHSGPRPKRHLDWFSHFCTTHCSVPILYNGRPLSPSILPLPMGGSGPPSNAWFLGSTQVLSPNSISIGLSVFAGLTTVTDTVKDRLTDHATGSVTVGRIYVRSMVMQLNNINPFSFQHFTM